MNTPFKINFRNRTAGFSLVEVALVGALIAGLSVGAMRFFGMMGRAGGQMNATRTATALRSSLISLVNSPRAWQRTIQEQAGGPLSCLAQGAAGNCRGAGGMIAIYNAAGEVEFSALANEGFSGSGSPCDRFDVNGSRGCPFRMEVEWEPICADPAPAVCRNPQVRVIGRLLYRNGDPTRGLAFNEANYSVNLVRGQPLSNASEFCLSIGAVWIEDEQRCNVKPAFCASINGAYDAATDSCSLPTEFDCENGQAVNQVNIIDGVAKATCIPVSDEFDPFDFQMSSRPWSDPELRNIPQEEVQGCATAATAEPSGLPCRHDRPAGSPGTCYYRVPMSGSTPNYSQAGWYRVGSGYCRGTIYVNQSYSPTFSPF